LTFKSIYEHIVVLARRGDLYKVTPLLPEGEIRRTLVVSRELNELFSAPPPDGISTSVLIAKFLRSNFGRGGI